jgi:hypothetical protein
MHEVRIDIHTWLVFLVMLGVIAALSVFLVDTYADFVGRIEIAMKSFLEDGQIAFRAIAFSLGWLALVCIDGILSLFVAAGIVSQIP